MKHSLLLIVVVVIIGALIFVAQGVIFSDDTVQSEDTQTATPSVEEVVITLTEEGYVPEEVTIKKGGTVTWRSETDGLFWPASNLHPSHRDYPGGFFDPKSPLEPEESWSFTFDELGDWKFHDHLAPYYTGTVHVKE